MNNPKHLELTFNLVCNFFHLDQDEVKGRSRKTEFKEARFYFFWLCRTYYTGQNRLSLQFIGNYVGRDHATVLNGCRKVVDWRETNKEYKSITNQLLVTLEGLHGDYSFRADIAAGKYTDDVASEFQNWEDKLILLQNHTLSDRTCEGWRRKKKLELIESLKSRLGKIKDYPYLYEDTKKAMMNQYYQENDTLSKV